MISFKNITKIYLPKTTALEGVCLDIKDKEFVSIVGRSGAGKTTLFKLFLVEEKPTQGKIFFENTDIAQLKNKEISLLRRKIGAIFQDYKLLDSRTIYENIAYVMEVTGATDKEIEKDVRQVLEIVELAERAEHFPRELSGGEKQRVAIARALIHRPEIILADEPTGNLDPYHTQDIIRLLLKINELGTTVILATHYKEIINGLGKRVVTLEQGKIIRDEEKGRFIL